MGLAVIQDMPSMSADGRQPSPDEQAEFGRQLEVMINEHKNYPSIVTWVIYNEGWAQLRNPPWPEGPLTDKVRELDPTRLIDSTSGWNDHGFGDFSVCHYGGNYYKYSNVRYRTIIITPTHSVAPRSLRCQLVPTTPTALASRASLVASATMFQQTSTSRKNIQLAKTDKAITQSLESSTGDRQHQRDI